MLLAKAPMEVRNQVFGHLAGVSFPIKSYWLNSEQFTFTSSRNFVAVPHYSSYGNLQGIMVVLKALDVLSQNPNHDYVTYTGGQLRQIAKRRDLKQIGTNKELRRRLQQYDKRQQRVNTHPAEKPVHMLAEGLREDLINFLGPLLALELKCYDPADAVYLASRFAGEREKVLRCGLLPSKEH